jgi:drug/metabolite transporter (DMT)-like permease
LIYLALSISSSVIIFIIFKLFSRYQINTLHAIVVNYIVACVSGIVAYESSINYTEIHSYGWFYYTLGLGALFIIVFNLMAITTQRSGLSVVSVATKMSVVIPVIFGLVYYKESFGVYKIIGVLLALIAVYLASIKSRDGNSTSTKNFILPALVFIGSGIIDTSIKFIENSFVAENDVPLFSATIFGTAAFIGLLVLVFKAVKGDFKFQLKNVIGGIALGIPNYFSIFFLVKALRSDLLDSSGIFTVNNVAVVMISTIFGIILFKESLSLKNWIGILLAIISIFLVTLSDF